MTGAGSLPGPAAGVPPGQASGVIRVLVAEDMQILRDTLAAVLNLEDDIEVVAEVTDGEAIVPAVIGQRPDAAVVDIGLPGRDGLTAPSRAASATGSAGAKKTSSLAPCPRPSPTPGRPGRPAHSSARTPRSCGLSPSPPSPSPVDRRHATEKGDKAP